VFGFSFAFLGECEEELISDSYWKRHINNYFNFEVIPIFYSGLGTFCPASTLSVKALMNFEVLEAGTFHHVVG
jgi:hypothetical protein